MLEHVPARLGRLLRNRRAGRDRLVVADPLIGRGTATIALSSPAFQEGRQLPVRFTADGAGVSPPLEWSGVPEAAASLVLIVEDPDAPTRRPLVHAIVWDMPATRRRMAEGAIVADRTGREDGDVGRNSFLREGWLPPNPPNGHGAHAYVFQLLALSDRPTIEPSPGRGAVVRAIRGKVVAAGVLTGTYARGEPVATDGEVERATAG